jgi:hypothetical protein
LELGPAPKRLAGVGDVWLVELTPRWTSRPPWRVRSASPARRVGLTDGLHGSVADRDMLLVDNCEQGLDACAEPCGLPAESNG